MQRVNGVKRQILAGGLVSFAVVLIVSFGVAIALKGGKSPSDWDVNAACRLHKGVRQITSHSNYMVAAVCMDGLYVRNPY